METSRRCATLVLVMAACLATATAASRKEFKYNVGPGAGVNIVNEFGPVTVKASSGDQVVIWATPHSGKIEVDCRQSGNRIEVRSHFLQAARQSEGQVDYEIWVPTDANVTVNSGTGPVRMEQLNGDISVQGETAQVEARSMNGVYLRIRTVSGPIILTDINNSHVEATSIGGSVSLTDVSGPKIYATSTRGGIRFDGDPSSGGEYQLTNHTGDIDVFMPANASVDVTARTVMGSVQNEFPLQQKTHPGFVPNAKSLTGISASGASMLQVSSFSGKIRVKKR